MAWQNSAAGMGNGGGPGGGGGEGSNHSQSQGTEYTLQGMPFSKSRFYSHLKIAKLGRAAGLMRSFSQV